jgi:hypothetical protein
MRVPKAELEALAAAAEYIELEGLPIAAKLKSLLARFEEKSKETVDPGHMTAMQVENALVAHSSGKVVPVTGARAIFWIKQAAVWNKIAPKLEDVETVARWLGRQGWMSATTIAETSYKWEQYLAKARADRTQVQVPKRREFTGE